MGCRGPGCSQCRGHLRTRGGSCTPEHSGGQETAFFCCCLFILTALLPVDLHWAPTPQGEGTQGSEGGLSSCRSTPMAASPRLLLMTRGAWGAGLLADSRMGQPGHVAHCRSNGRRRTQSRCSWWKRDQGQAESRSRGNSYQELPPCSPCD